MLLVVQVRVNVVASCKCASAFRLLRSDALRVSFDGGSLRFLQVVQNKPLSLECTRINTQKATNILLQYFLVRSPFILPLFSKE